MSPDRRIEMTDVMVQCSDCKQAHKSCLRWIGNVTRESSAHSWCGYTVEGRIIHKTPALTNIKSVSILVLWHLIKLIHTFKLHAIYCILLRYVWLPFLRTSNLFVERFGSQAWASEGAENVVIFSTHSIYLWKTYEPNIGREAQKRGTLQDLCDL